MLLRLTTRDDPDDEPYELAINPSCVLWMNAASDGKRTCVHHANGGHFLVEEPYAEAVARWEAALRGGSDG